ncbi:alpha/beta fold hydrolase [Flammeovirga kamogawensis]|uniref:Alpha/beta hydrolase n=1 Tax=Flammeovirga kamogawensis TaxID=373891 RepID=A0ABX8GTS5_9BACT|nr:alpha/beta hydrolase [Flammeovirga kamogawensis]MBB6459944.1 pimeloyl-ACP methyl ester carboxylesterase [Flammeovirga kamogawensis]QWG07003.1 alpha/beta hydrolase [Flammeovirga kamogawensis]TRX68824.1 alpha/beta hydrolase [Flammeovirga kamogawensis]
MKDLDTKYDIFNVFGEGKDLLICIHGYGQTYKVFSTLPNILKNTIILTINLPHHPFQNKLDNLDSQIYFTEIITFIEKLTSEKKIKNWSICGYSIGARIACFLYLRFPTKCKELHLIAPDGIGDNVIFPIATAKLIQPVFKLIMTNAVKVSKLISVAKFLNIISVKQERFIKQNLTNNLYSSRIAETWISISVANFSKTDLINKVKKTESKLLLFLGKYDAVILKKDLDNFILQLPKESIIYLEADHNRALFKYFEWLKTKKTSQDAS